MQIQEKIFGGIFPDVVLFSDGHLIVIEHRSFTLYSQLLQSLSELIKYALASGLLGLALPTPLLPHGAVTLPH